jgi:hypothetical protein
VVTTELIPATQSIFRVPVGVIDLGKFQPREQIDLDHAAQLADSIRAMGQLTPIIIVPNPDQPGRFCTVTGEHRYWAIAHILNWTHIDARIDQSGRDPDDIRDQATADNTSQLGYVPMELSREITRMIGVRVGRRGMSKTEAHQDVAKILSLTIPTVYRYESLGNLIHEAQILLGRKVEKRRRLPLSAAFALATIPQGKQSEILAQQTQRGGRLRFQNIVRSVKEATAMGGGQTHRNAPRQIKPSNVFESLQARMEGGMVDQTSMLGKVTPDTLARAMSHRSDAIPQEWLTALERAIGNLEHFRRTLTEYIANRNS